VRSAPPCSAAAQVFDFGSADASRGELEEFGRTIAAVIGGALLTGVDGDWLRIFLGCVLLSAVMFNTQVRQRVTGAIDADAARQIAHDEMRKIGIDVRDPEQPIGTMSGGERQSLAIARAVHFGARVLILDEPTSALGVRQTSMVLRYIAQLREQGIGIIFITHNVHQPLRWAIASPCSTAGARSALSCAPNSDAPSPSSRSPQASRTRGRSVRRSLSREAHAGASGSTRAQECSANANIVIEKGAQTVPIACKCRPRERHRGRPPRAGHRVRRGRSVG
jgi:hypothetical protein